MTMEQLTRRKNTQFFLKKKAAFLFTEIIHLDWVPVFTIACFLTHH